MISREEVYAALDGERDYQEKKWGNLNKTVNSISAFSFWMEYQLDELRKLAGTQDESDGTPAAEQMMHIMRKLTAMGVACMEIHGAPKRKVV